MLPAAFERKQSLSSEEAARPQPFFPNSPLPTPCCAPFPPAVPQHFKSPQSFTHLHPWTVLMLTPFGSNAYLSGELLLMLQNLTQMWPPHNFGGHAPASPALGRRLTRVFVCAPRGGLSVPLGRACHLACRVCSRSDFPTTHWTLLG